MTNPSWLLGLLEPDFVNPVFRMMFNQTPYKVKVVWVVQPKHDGNRIFVKALKSVSEPTVLVVKDESGNLLETLFVPVSKEDDMAKFSSLPLDQSLSCLLKPMMSEGY